jgi:hypothetical protein
MNVSSHFGTADGPKVGTIQVSSDFELQHVSGGGISVPLPPPSLVGNRPQERRDRDLPYRSVALDAYSTFG